MSDNIRLPINPEWSKVRKCEEAISYLCHIRNESSPMILDWIIDQLICARSSACFQDIARTGDGGYRS